MEAIWEAHLEADQLLTDAGVDIRQVEADRAYYRLSADGIVLPKWEQFSSANHCYQTALHELGHAMGHSERMNHRSLIEGLKAGLWFRGLCPRGVAGRNQSHDDGRDNQDRSRPQPGRRLCRELDRGFGKGYPGKSAGRRPCAQKISDYVLVRSRQRPGRRERQAAKSVPSRTPPNAATLLPRARPKKSWQVHGADFSRVRLPH